MTATSAGRPGTANIERDEEGRLSREWDADYTVTANADSGIARFATAGKASYSRLPVERRYYNPPWLYTL